MIVLLLPLACQKQSDTPSPASNQPPVLPVESEPNKESGLPVDPIQVNPAEKEPQPEAVYRPSDTRRVLSAEEISRFGLNMVESKHLRIYSDLPLKEITSLPAIIDQAYDSWLDYFGPLPENREGTEFQITGYVMEDVERFRNAGLIPDRFSVLGNGRHLGAEFWMPVPEPGYYRRHLLIHEATHCYMMYLPRTSAPVWYLEGMAELFATHHQEESGECHFRVFPDSTEKFPGLGRIELVQREIEKSGLKTLLELDQLEVTGFQNVTSYAWAWAFCAFLDQHPEYQSRFQQMGRDYLLEVPLNDLIRKEFNGEELRQLNQAWLAYVNEIEYGLEVADMVIPFQPGSSLEAEANASLEIHADQYWQSTKWKLQEGRSYRLSAEGEFTLADQPKPWLSQANGISFQYYQGFPVGRLLGAIVPDSKPSPGQPYTKHDHCFARPASFGNDIVFKAPYSGTLYLRLNEAPTNLSDNSGSVQVTIEELDSSFAENQK